MGNSKILAMKALNRFQRVQQVLNWIDRPLGCFYFYCADHKGLYIWLAYADALTGLWRIYKPGSLRLSQTLFAQEEIEPTE